MRNICWSSKERKRFLVRVWIICCRSFGWCGCWCSFGRYVGTLCSYRKAVCFKWCFWALTACLCCSSQQVPEIYCIYVNISASEPVFWLAISWILWPLVCSSSWVGKIQEQKLCYCMDILYWPILFLYFQFFKLLLSRRIYMDLFCSFTIHCLMISTMSFVFTQCFWSGKARMQIFIAAADCYILLQGNTYKMCSFYKYSWVWFPRQNSITILFLVHVYRQKNSLFIFTTPAFVLLHILWLSDIVCSCLVPHSHLLTFLCVIQGVLYGSVGFGCGLIGQGIANMIMTAKRYVSS